jgi:anaerobic magnesium-protoporphyrin IX monomethyl ester cyclase
VTENHESVLNMKGDKSMANEDMAGFAVDSNPEVAVIVPQVVVHHLDPHTGIPFMPHMAAHLAGALHAAQVPMQVLDAFGSSHHQRTIVQNEFMLMGLKTDELVLSIAPTVRVCCIYCRTIAEFIAVERLIDAIKATRKEIKIILFENIQAVTSFSLSLVADKFLERGADYILLGEPEDRIVSLFNAIISEESVAEIPGLIYRTEQKDVQAAEREKFVTELVKLPLPAWNYFQLQGYWNMGFAHAPCQKGTKFLPILTSRGCPYQCRFCIIPSLNQKWRYRTAQHVFEEMKYFYENMGIEDFHVSDLNPTVLESRIRELCHLLIDARLPITWKVAQGTKIETIKDISTIELMARAGCKFLSFSPESGSQLMKIIKKPFDYQKGLNIVKETNRLGIRTQACFLVGLPEETLADQKLSFQYVKKLVTAGLDEISCYIFTPVPGSDLYESMSGYTHFSQLTPAPNWRADYKKLSKVRYKLYLTYFFYKLKYPRKVLRVIKGLLTKKFETKMEMSLYKVFKIVLMRYIPFLYK